MEFGNNEVKLSVFLYENRILGNMDLKFSWKHSGENANVLVLYTKFYVWQSFIAPSYFARNQVFLYQARDRNFYIRNPMPECIHLWRKGNDKMAHAFVRIICVEHYNKRNWQGRWPIIY